MNDISDPQIDRFSFEVVLLNILRYWSFQVRKMNLLLGKKT